jgi:hypothetical protein
MRVSCCAATQEQHGRRSAAADRLVRHKQTCVSSVRHDRGRVHGGHTAEHLQRGIQMEPTAPATRRKPTDAERHNLVMLDMARPMLLDPCDRAMDSRTGAPERVVTPCCTPTTSTCAHLTGFVGVRP